MICDRRSSSILLLCALIIAPASVNGGGLVLTDVTESAGLATSHQPITNWACGIYECGVNMSAGGAVGDFNNDGFQDLFALSGGGGPDRLFINNGDGTFTDEATAWGVAIAHAGVGAAVGDFDNDGWLDIFITSWGPATGPLTSGQHILWRNNSGSGTSGFTNVALSAGVNQTSTSQPDGFGAAFGDYDLDGDLDLFVCGWIAKSGGNRLFQNNGDGTFTDVTASAIPTDLVVMRGFSPCFADMNGDRYPELLIAADFNTSRYLVNNTDGTFTDLSGPVLSGTGIDQNGMGQAIGDFNGDGLLDWYVTSIHFDQFDKFGINTGNMLYLNQGNHHFTEVSQSADVSNGGWGWGTVAVDLDHDGDLDLIETNGWQTDKPHGDRYVGEFSRVYLNNGTGIFDDVALVVGMDHNLQGRGLLNFDYDNDGDQDLVFFAADEPLKLYRNDLDHTGANWLRLFFDTSTHENLAPNGVGTKVETTIAGVRRVSYLDGGCHYLSQSELSVHLGLGDAEFVETLRIRWANGLVTILHDVAANQTITISSAGAEPIIGDVNIDGVVNDVDLFNVLSAWGSCPTPCPGESSACVDDVNGDCKVNIDDLLAVLANWG